MTDNDRNARTLIVCFVLAVMSLTALKFVELKQNVTTVSNSYVLGETTQKEEVVLPNAELESGVLEVNYIGR